ncbi:MAG: T9SS type A sorting domain-containing protein [Saprospiraceae bacterium]
MKKLLPLIFLFLLLFAKNPSAQLTLNANGPGNTYELITSKLAPNYNPIEVPDCGHSVFGRHIDEVFDAELNDHVFRFLIHVEEDDDRCINFDRQRNEIKTYDQSPDSLLGTEGEIVEYKWKFKLDAGHQSSPKFTHIHQLKAVGGTEASMPLITLTTRSGTPEELELRYAETTTAVELHAVDLAPFKGTWCEVTETVTYGESGSYNIIIKKISDNSMMFSYSNNDIRMWKTEAEFIRPKWGIYRSLQFVSDLRDEEVLFANFSIEELSINLTDNFLSTTTKIQLFPNPTFDSIQILGTNKNLFFEIFSSTGIKIQEGYISNNQLSLSTLPNAIYFLKLHIGNKTLTKRIVKK